MNPVADNPLLTRGDLALAARQLMEPLIPCLTPGRARMITGEGSAHYPEDVAGMEGYSRVLWALVPMLCGGCEEADRFWLLWREGLINGTDPEHAEYWGDIRNSDQRMVEMAVIGMGLCLLPDRFYHDLPKDAQDHLYAWLNQINLYDMPKNNWRFFRVLVNVGFETVGRPVDESRLEEDLNLLESHYVGDGWYFDYETKRDYYTLWAFHYYGLIYARVRMDKDPERCRRFIERAALIAPRFACWFDAEGRGLPYGRSLTYRFAQSSFFAALAFAHVQVPGMDPGQIKGLLLRNLRFWMRQPIFDRGGALTVGYGYPNLCAAEGYNAQGSPYWAMKVFLPLALGADDAFWQAEEKPYTPPETFLDREVRLLTVRDAENRQVLAFTAGNHGWEHMHEDEKYEKFVYSTQFGFSVVKEATGLNRGAYDSMLAVKRRGRDLWHMRSGCESYSLSEDKISFTWSPMEGVMIDTVIAPLGMWHVRKHVIHTAFPLEAAEGAFSVRKDWAGARPCDRVASALCESENAAGAHGAYGSTAIFALRGFEKGTVVHTEPNTNLMYPRCVLPMLLARLDAGEHVLISAVFADSGDVMPASVPEEVLRLAESL